MTEKSEFNAEEWSTVLEGPAIAALRVITAERGGTIRETYQMGKAYAEERQNHQNSELLDAIVVEQPQVKPGEYGDPAEIETAGMEKLREAVGILERAGTSVEVDDYKRFTYAMADRVARAHKEGGFLGIGGKEVSEDERTALDQIAATLEYEVPAELEASDEEE